MMIICYFFFSPADISFLRSISLSISLEILSSVIRAYPCVVLILECPIILAILSMGISAEIKKCRSCADFGDRSSFPLSLWLFPIREPQTIGHHGWEEETRASRHRSCYTATISAPAMGCKGMNASTFVFLRLMRMYRLPSAFVPIWWG